MAAHAQSSNTLACSACTFVNPTGRATCRMCSTPMGNSRSQARTTGPPWTCSAVARLPLPPSPPPLPHRSVLWLTIDASLLVCSAPSSMTVWPASASSASSHAQRQLRSPLPPPLPHPSALLPSLPRPSPPLPSPSPPQRTPLPTAADTAAHATRTPPTLPPTSCRIPTQTTTTTTTTRVEGRMTTTMEPTNLLPLHLRPLRLPCRTRRRSRCTPCSWTCARCTGRVSRTRPSPSPRRRSTRSLPACPPSSVACTSS